MCNHERWCVVVFPSWPDRGIRTLNPDDNLADPVAINLRLSAANTSYKSRALRETKNNDGKTEKISSESHVGGRTCFDNKNAHIAEVDIAHRTGTAAAGSDDAISATSATAASIARRAVAAGTRPRIATHCAICYSTLLFADTGSTSTRGNVRARVSAWEPTRQPRPCFKTDSKNLACSDKPLIVPSRCVSTTQSVSGTRPTAT